MVVAVFYWLATITVAKGTSSLAGIGLLMSALSPFALFKFCTPDTPESLAATAIGLWSGIRALLIAVTITIISEFIHVPGLFTTLSRKSLDETFTAMQTAFKSVWGEGDAKEAKKKVDAALATVSAKVGDAEAFNIASKMEPRFWKCQWKSQFVQETCDQFKKIRLDVLLIKQAMCGLDGKMEVIIELLNKVKAVSDMRKDLDSTLVDAQELTIALLEHEFGKFEGLKCLDTVEGLDQLDGYDDAIVEQSSTLTFPDKAPETMEDDVLVRLSIVYVMLDYLVQHTSAIIQGAVKLS